MEGIAGVSHPIHAERGDLRYGEKVELMTGEANAAIEGALAGGATEVVVNDSHGEMHNLLPEALHPAARLVQGQKAWSMVAAADVAAGASPQADGSFDVALFVGYHARAGHPTATIAHTYSGRPTLTQLNGIPVGETGINALVLGAWGSRSAS
jgi:D-amino peptidase